MAPYWTRIQVLWLHIDNEVEETRTSLAKREGLIRGCNNESTNLGEYLKHTML
jgi:hypothetical protein